jgi:lipopolysaccharide transport system permease protein
MTVITERIIKPKRGLVPLDFKELYQYRELFWVLSWRNVLIRYKQTYLGVAWAVLQPLLTMVVFTVIFGQVAKMDSKGVPFAVFNFAALLPWLFFANALSEGSNSLVASQNMITKVYFPRLIIPAGAVVSGLLDFLISLGLLFLLMLWYEVPFRATLLLLPVCFLFNFMAALACALWFGALNVKYRDVKYVVPFVVRMGIYLSPVGYLSDALYAKLGYWYALNPLVGVIDCFRWCILGDAFVPNWNGVLIGGVVCALLLISGAYYFRSTERTFADII